METPKVSVLMSVHNGEQYLRESVDSILGQTFRDFEFVILNNGSTDSTREILESYRDPRVILCHQGNLGITRSLNKGITIARGEYIARQDADDVSMPERLEKQVEFINNNPRIILLGSRANIIDKDGNLRDTWIYPTKHCHIAWRLLFENCFVNSSVIFKKQNVIDIGCYSNSTSFAFAEDYELWTRLIKAGETAQIPETLVKCRRFIDSAGSRHSKEQDSSALHIAFIYAKTILSEIDYETFKNIFSKPINNDLNLHQAKEATLLTEKLLSEFTHKYDYDSACKQDIYHNISIRYLRWAKYNWKNPYCFLYLIVRATFMQLSCKRLFF